MELAGDKLQARRQAVRAGLPVLPGAGVEGVEEAREVAEGIGYVAHFAIPALPGLRVDTHCVAGAVVPPFYESLLGKLIAHGSDRAEAISILLEALDGARIEGVSTNRQLLGQVLGHPDFIAGAVSTHWLEKILPELQEVVV